LIFSNGKTLSLNASHHYSIVSLIKYSFCALLY
jgi:hypothetical protein